MFAWTHDASRYTAICTGAADPQLVHVYVRAWAHGAGYLASGCRCDCVMRFAVTSWRGQCNACRAIGAHMSPEPTRQGCALAVAVKGREPTASNTPVVPFRASRKIRSMQAASASTRNQIVQVDGQCDQLTALASAANSDYINAAASDGALRAHFFSLRKWNRAKKRLLSRAQLH